MVTEKLFTERQHFKQIWLWVLLGAIDLLFIYGLIKQIFLGQVFGDTPISNGLLIFLTVAACLLTILFVFLRLDTLINNDGIYYRFLPFQLTYREIPWSRISKALICEYSPLSEYGGWGIRFGLSGQAVNISGNKGLQLVYDSKKLLIGTQKPEEMEQVLKQLGRLTTDN